MDVTDKRGRKLTVRELSPSAQLDLFEACGSNSSNPSWVSMALLVCSVTAIDDIPRPAPMSVKDIKSRADELGHDGIAAVNEALRDEKVGAADRDVAKN